MPIVKNTIIHFSPFEKIGLRGGGSNKSSPKIKIGATA